MTTFLAASPYFLFTVSYRFPTPTYPPSFSYHTPRATAIASLFWVLFGLETPLGQWFWGAWEMLGDEFYIY